MERYQRTKTRENKIKYNNYIMTKSKRDKQNSNYSYFTRRKTKIKTKIKGGKWSMKYKKNINCSHPKGFSKKQH